MRPALYRRPRRAWVKSDPSQAQPPACVLRSRAVAVAESRPSPSAILRESLDASRAEGRPWPEAWELAVAEALRDVPGGRRHVEQWRETVVWSKRYFRYAYTARGRDVCGRQIYDLG